MQLDLGHFLPTGTVMSFMSSSLCGSRASPLYLRRSNIFTDLPLTVLVGGQTISMGEVFTAPLQDHNRATVIGQTTAGKAYGIASFRMPNQPYVIEISGNQYLRPNGQPIEYVGITPDIYLRPTFASDSPTLAEELAVQTAINVIRQKNAGIP